MEFSKDWLERQWQQYQDKKREEEVEEAHDSIQSDSGYFPIGLNLTWHGGIHCRASSDGSVHAMTDGVVVAVRLPDKDPVKLSYGSRNFVLVKHKTPLGNPFWTLYMHLRPVLLKPDDPHMPSVFPWLLKRSLTRVGEGTSNLRKAPDAEQGEVLRELDPGETFDVLDDRTVGAQKWFFVQTKKDDVTGWVAQTSKFELKSEIPGLEDIKAGKVVKLSAPVKRGDCLGFISPAPAGKDPFLHWEVFSNGVVSDKWIQVKDDDALKNDIVCDAVEFKQIMNKSQAVTFFHPLNKDNIREAYRDPKTAAQIRSRTFFFKSEWAVIWDTALDRLKNDYDVEDLAPRLQLYNFWKDAETLGCDLPKGGSVWHYHPTEFMAREYPVPKALESPVPDDGQLISSAQLKVITRATDVRIKLFKNELNDACKEKGINIDLRLCHFLAQVALESGCLKYVEEIADGSRYEGRRSLGNTELGDGKRFKGRGLIQITGRANYKKLSEAYGEDFTTDEGALKLKEPHMACRSAVWFWESNNLNTLADVDNGVQITYRVNGGFNGLAERLKFLKRAYSAYSVDNEEGRITQQVESVRKNMSEVQSAFGSEPILMRPDRKSLSRVELKEYERKVEVIKRSSGLKNFNLTLYDYFNTESSIQELLKKVNS